MGCPMVDPQGMGLNPTQAVAGRGLRLLHAVF